MAIDIIARGMIESSKNDISQLFDITKGGEIVSNESSYTLNNAVNYPLLGLNLYGKSTQDGTPTPENPVEIVSVGDSGFDIVSAGDNEFTVISCIVNNDIITSQPVSAAVKVGEVATFSVTATGAGLTYQWQLSKNGGNTWNNTGVNGNKTSTIRLPKAEASSNGFQYRCAVTDANGNTVISYAATFYVFADDIAIKTDCIVLPDALCGIPVNSDGNYTDSNGQQWVCDELIYNADGSGKIIKRTAKIDGYNGETVSGVYISSTGSLDTGAAIIYQLDTPQESELTAAEMAVLRELQTFNGVTNISNDSGADMGVKICTNKTLSEYVMPITTGLQAQIDELKAAVISLGGNV